MLVPNQEIVVQFNADAVSDQQTQDAITNVTSRLQSIGIERIQVVEDFRGNLKITYYSAVTVEVVKSLLAKEQLQLAQNTQQDNKQPFGEYPKTYQLNISEIQLAEGANMGLNGTLVEVKSGFEWYINPLNYLGGASMEIGLGQTFEDIAFTCYGDVALGIDTASYKIPEVRAGPLA